MPEQPLIPITVRLSSRAHKILTHRARVLGRDRDVEAGRVLHRALLDLIVSGQRRREITQRLEASRGAQLAQSAIDSER